MRLILLSLLFLLPACIPSEPVSDTPYYSDYLHVVEEWNADLTLPAADCNEPEIAILSDEEFQKHSGLCAYPNCDDTCFFCAAGYTIYQRNHAVLVLSSHLDEESQHEVVKHESVHALSTCSGHSSTWDGTRYLWVNGDSAHADPRLWGLDGVLDRARLLTE